MSEHSPILGHLGEELQPLFAEYQQLQATAPTEPYFVRYVPEIKLDKGKEGFTISGFEHKLTQAGFATDSLRGLLAKCVEYNNNPSIEIDQIDLDIIASLKAVPEELRKKVRVTSDSYYYAGNHHPTV